MSTRETQDKIIRAAVEQFNAAGASRVSTNRIAEKAGVSRGNLHYHFSDKKHLILAIWLKIEQEINGWSDEIESPSVSHIAEMTLRQFRLIWQYRFFYQELNILLEADSELKHRFNRLRANRMESILLFLRRLQETGSIKPSIKDSDLRMLVKISWVLTDFWLPFISVEQETIEVSTMQDGYELILQLFTPTLTEKALMEIPASLRVFSIADDASTLSSGDPLTERPQAAKSSHQ